MAKNGICGVTVTFDLSPTNSNQFILWVQEAVCAKFEEIPSECSWDIMFRRLELENGESFWTLLKVSQSFFYVYISAQPLWWSFTSYCYLNLQSRCPLPLPRYSPHYLNLTPSSLFSLCSLSTSSLPSHLLPGPVSSQPASRHICLPLGFLKTLWIVQTSLWAAPKEEFKTVWISQCLGGTVASKQAGSNPAWGPSVWSLHVLPVLAWVFSGFSSFLPQYKDSLFLPQCHHHTELYTERTAPQGQYLYCAITTCVPYWYSYL